MTEKYYVDFEALSYYNAQKESKNVLLYDSNNVILAQKVVPEEGGSETANSVTGKGSVTFGHTNINKGKYALMFGLQNEASHLAPSSLVGGKGCKVGAKGEHANYAVALGRSCQANGYYTFSAGHENIVNGEASASFGHGNKVDSKQSFVSGSNNIVAADALNSFVAGTNNQVNHIGSVVLGSRLNTDTTYQTLVGIGNISVAEGLFVVGNGFGETESNAFVVLRDGRAQVSKAPQSELDVVRKLELDKQSDKLSENISTVNTRVTDINQALNSKISSEIKELSDSIIVTDPSIKLVYDDRDGIYSAHLPTYGPDSVTSEGESQLRGGTYQITKLRYQDDPGWWNCYLKIYAGDKLVYHIGYDENNRDGFVNIGQNETFTVTLPYIENANDFTVVTNSQYVKFTSVAQSGSDKFNELGIDINNIKETHAAEIEEKDKQISALQEQINNLSQQLTALQTIVNTLINEPIADETIDSLFDENLGG